MIPSPHMVPFGALHTYDKQTLRDKAPTHITYNEEKRGDGARPDPPQFCSQETTPRNSRVSALLNLPGAATP